MGHGTANALTPPRPEAPSSETTHGRDIGHAAPPQQHPQHRARGSGGTSLHPPHRTHCDDHGGHVAPRFGQRGARPSPRHPCGNGACESGLCDELCSQLRRDCPPSCATTRRPQPNTGRSSSPSRWSLHNCTDVISKRLSSRAQISSIPARLCLANSACSWIRRDPATPCWPWG